MQAATHLARAEGVDESGWRLVTNVGPDAGQIGVPPAFPSAGRAPDGVASGLERARICKRPPIGRPFVTQEGTGLAPRETRHVASGTTQVKILVPGNHSMVALLGQRDAFLKLIESAFACDVLVRGNEITITGPEQEAERVARIFEELMALLEKGHELTDASVGQAIALVKGDEVDEQGAARAAAVGDPRATSCSRRAARASRPRPPGRSGTSTRSAAPR